MCARNERLVEDYIYSSVCLRSSRKKQELTAKNNKSGNNASKWAIFLRFSDKMAHKSPRSLKNGGNKMIFCRGYHGRDARAPRGYRLISCGSDA